MHHPVIRRRTLVAALAGGAVPAALFAQAGYPNRAIELIVPAGAGGGTDVLARAFAEAAKKHLPQPVTVVNRPGASGMIGHGELINAKPDGYKLAIVFAEIVIVPHLGLSKLSYEDFTPIARLNADPAAITVRADAPWNTIEEFLAASRARPGEIKMGNSGPGSIWHLAHAALEDKVGVKYNPIPFSGAAPAVLALMGGHVDAVAVSPGEVATHVAGGKLKTLAVMADQRLKGFDRVPTLKERGIDLAIGTWRGLAAPKGTPPEVIAVLVEATRKSADEAVLKEALDRLSMGQSYAEAETFRAGMKRDNEVFKQLVTKLGIKG
ncbi:Bug family tripartite tricarboxylate transporter substrate binding protein [Aquabacterium sp.]|uniref:Bug family tripartite tricarboxylate transporter substrate binding protein n=1 Tax=Aquabacterium sp. TaxID=1872578 RepID=UPI002C038825|nr:tripartite tricarboxylate transporter substrate binding protein [Aquabacterium sp.]HSW03454.1 tripartite tricarboxylate transporter substrate binding protein [Aquabacterium sp.]